MRNDYSKFTLVEMLRSYAEGTEEDTLGGNQRLDAADHIEALETKVEELTRLLKEASCPTCNGDGAEYEHYMGNVHQCQWCCETKKALKQEGE